MILRVPFVTNREPYYPTSQTPFGNHKGIRPVKLWIELHKSLHTLSVQNKLIVPLLRYRGRTN